jgi:AcrR family transcriptional regulator
LVERLMEAKIEVPKGPRQRILDAALDEFAAYGLAGARVQRIARRAGINKAMLYYYFGSKERLYLEVLKTQVGMRAASVAREFDSGKDLEGILQFIAETYYTFLAPGTKLAPLFLREMAGGGERLRQVVPDLVIHKDLPGKLRDIIEKGKAEGRFRDIDLRQAIASFVGMCFFYLLAGPLVNEVWEIRDAEKFRQERPKAIVDLFMRGLEAR